MDFRPSMKLNTKFMSSITQKSHLTQEMDTLGPLGSLSLGNRQEAALFVVLGVCSSL